MYRVEINQKTETTLNNGETYNRVETVELDVNAIEDIETILGLFINKDTNITISLAD